ncbi:MAG TPA: ADOP family duplicated permease, partial [Gemmatimonadaceae bacterium]|nr:ADOP family duplicated permease [Gemmatimonadaceae bacterium]
STLASHPVAVVSHRYWERQLRGDSGAVGRTIRVNGHPFTVVGVAQPEFADASALFKPQLWTPMMMAPVTRPDFHLDSRGDNTLQLVGRLANGVTSTAAETELKSIAKQIGVENGPVSAGRGVRLYPYSRLPTDARQGVAIFMALLMSFSVLILLVTCSNLTSMLLARAIRRRREIATRVALGAGRGRLVRQLVTETAVLFAGGGVFGTGLAFAGTRALAAFAPPVDLPIEFDISMDARVLGFTLLVVMSVGVLFGLLPALRSTRIGVAAALKRASGTMSGNSRLRSAVVVGQIAFTLLLLVEAALITRTLRSALDVDPGFDFRGLQIATTNLQMRGYSGEAGARLLDAWRERVAGAPGVSGVAFTTRPALGLGNSTVAFKVVGEESPQPARRSADYAAVSPGYFTVLGTSLVAGRAFVAADNDLAPRVAVVSAELARRYFQSPVRAVGRELQTGATDADRVTIIGVAADVKVRSLVEVPRPFLYRPIAQAHANEVSALVRTKPSDEASVRPAIRAALRAVDADLPLLSAMTYSQYIGMTLLPQRLAAIVAAVLGCAGLLLAAVGIYGVVAFAMSQRSREIGIRLAIGATPWRVTTLVASEGARLAGLGISVGLLLAFLASRLLRAFLMGVSPTDPLAFVVATGGLAAVALAASLIPARRAARVDPMVALRTD